MSSLNLSPESYEILTDYHWPGNVRELVRVLEAAVSAAGTSQILYGKHLPEYIRIVAAKKKLQSSKPEASPCRSSMHPASLPTFKSYRKNEIARIEKAYLQKLIDVTGADPKTACRMAGLSRSRYYGLLKEHGLRPRR